MKKLTLDVDDDVFRDAERLAGESGTSVSDFFSRLVRVLARKQPTAESDDGLSPTVRRLSGIISVPADKSDRELIEEAIIERHGLDE